MSSILKSVNKDELLDVTANVEGEMQCLPMKNNKHFHHCKSFLSLLDAEEHPLSKIDSSVCFISEKSSYCIQAIDNMCKVMNLKNIVILLLSSRCRI